MTGKSRIVFVDQARALAVIMMLVGHSLDRFLGEPWRSSQAYTNYQFVRGLSSALFLTIAGFSFVIASFSRIEAYTRLSDRMAARLGRIGFILFLGMLLQIPSMTLQELLQTEDPLRWERFWSFNVLQNIGLGLLLLHGILFVTKRVDRFVLATVVGAAVIFAAARLTYRPDVDAILPVVLRGALNLSHQSRFPMIPFTGFIFIGALFGVAYSSVRETRREPWLFVVASVFGGALVVFEQYLRRGGLGGLFPFATGEMYTPGNTFARLGCALLIISTIYLLSRFRVVLAHIAQVISKDSLAIYFVHLMIVYGSALQKGVLYRKAHGMTPGQAFLFISALVLAMYGMANGIGYLRRRHPSQLTALRRSALLACLFVFLFLPYVSPWGILVAFAAASLVVCRQPLTNRLLRRPPLDRAVDE